RTGTSPGSPEYMAPEVVDEGAPTPAYDQYGLAAVVYRALTGGPVHEGSNPHVVLHKKATVPPQPLRDRVPGLDERFDHVVAKALARRPEDRYPNCTAFAADFGRAVRGEVVEAASAPTTASGAETRVLTPAPSRAGGGRLWRLRRWHLVAIAGSVALAVLLW